MRLQRLRERLAPFWLFVGAVTFAGACSVSPEQEVAIGSADAAQIDSELPLIHDSAIVGFIATLGQSMAARTSRGDLKWHLALKARYSQRDEAEAHSEGVMNTLRVGIDPEGLPSFFEKLLETQAQQPTVVEAFFSTHPTDAARVAGTRRQIAATPGAQRQNLVRDTPEFHAIQARLHTLPLPPPAPTPE